MFFRMLRGALFRQKSKMIMIAITIALGASLATAMLNIMFDVGDKMNQELKIYGANITILNAQKIVLIFPSSSSLRKADVSSFSSISYRPLRTELALGTTVIFAP